MLWSFVLLAIGFGMLRFAFMPDQPPQLKRLGELFPFLILAIFFGSGSFICAGLLLPFKKTAVGAMIGPVAVLVGFILVAFAMNGFRW